MAGEIFGQGGVFGDEWPEPWLEDQYREESALRRELGISGAAVDLVKRLEQQRSDPAIGFAPARPILWHVRKGRSVVLGRIPDPHRQRAALARRAAKRLLARL